MDSQNTRTLMTDLAADLGWLEQHCSDDPEQAVQLRLAAALVRNCIGPFLDDRAATPLHVAVVGGAGAGKSTVANLLAGAALAEANPQAGYTRHPVAYTSNQGALAWTGHVGFLGPLQRLSEPRGSDLDEDVYQVRRVPADGDGSLLPDFVVWDCPDMTTWAAAGYVSRLLEVAARADVLVYVASDERYNDAVPTDFLHLLCQTGKPVVCCLVKMREADAPALTAHFQREVAAKMPGGVVACLPIPFLTREELADPIRKAARFRVPLVNQIAVLGRPAAQARTRSVYGATRFLVAVHDRLLNAARRDVEALQAWQGVVEAGRAEFENRYRREYLTTEKFHRFDEALVRLLDLLELPGVGKLLGGALWVVRTPYRLLMGFVSKAFARPDAPVMPEQPVLDQALNGWVDALRKEAARREDSHPLWAHVEHGFRSGLGQEIRDRFQQGCRAFQLSQAEEVDRTARAIYEELEKSPTLLNTLRGGKLAIDAAAVGGALVLGGGINWTDLILVPLAASVTHHLVELLGKQYVDGQREEARRRQDALLAQHVAGPLADWLVAWPATGGSSFERLQLALRRIPTAVAQLDAAVTKTLRAG